MKKYILHLLFLVIIAAAFFFIYFSASTGNLPFEDTRETELRAGLSGAVAAFEDEAKAVLLGLRTLAQDEAIRLVFGMGVDKQDASDQGRAVLRQFAEAWPQIRSLCVFDTNNRIVLDMQEASPDEAPDANDALVFDKLSDGFEFLEDGRAQTAVRLTGDIGFLYAVFNPSFITRFFDAEKEERSAVCARDGVLFVAKEGTLPVGDTLPELAVSLLGADVSMPLAFGGKIYAQIQSDISRQRIALQAGYSPHELPAFAIQLLVITALVFLALLLLLVLRMFHYQDTASTRRKLDRNAELSEEARVSAEEIIQAADLLYSQAEYSALDDSSIAKGVPSLEEMPTLQTILSRSESSIPKRYNPDLDRAIHAVTDTHNAPLSDLPRPETAEPHDIAWYWSKIIPMLHSASGLLLLCDDGEGAFAARYVHGFTSAQLEGCYISRSDKLYQQFAAKQKILYIKEAALQNRTLRSFFPGIPASSVDQMVILPVTQNSEVIALLVITQATGAGFFDQTGLQEIHNFSML
ncbi:MAG: hypothetical protein LBC99_05840 [Spirochaetota bacterium]|nr:hypothetical protein [Spirochaetota bacterium]